MNFFNWYYSAISPNIDIIKTQMEKVIWAYIAILIYFLLVFCIQTLLHRKDIEKYKSYLKKILLTSISLVIVFTSVFIVQWLFRINSFLLSSTNCVSTNKTIQFFFSTIWLQVFCYILFISILILIWTYKKCFIKISKRAPILILLYMIFLNILYCL